MKLILGLVIGVSITYYALRVYPPKPQNSEVPKTETQKSNADTQKLKANTQKYREKLRRFKERAGKRPQVSASCELSGSASKDRGRQKVASAEIELDPLIVANQTFTQCLKQVNQYKKIRLKEICSSNDDEKYRVKVAIKWQQRTMTRSFGFNCLYPDRF